MINFYDSIGAMMLVVGVDAGGTASRAVLSTIDGLVLGRGRAGPGNPFAIGSRAATSIGTAIREALGDHDPASVASVVVGLAGVSRLSDPVLAEAFTAQWAAIGLTCPVTVVGDAVTALAAGAAARSGVVLIAGTGAVAARVDDGRVVATADGLGWLLGDEGSGLWLGLQAVRVAARSWPSSFAGKIAAHAGVSSCDELVHWAGQLPPAAFAELSPLVCALAAEGDPLAGRLIDRAVICLLATLDELGPPGGPVVLAGGLLTAATPVRDGVLRALRSRNTVVETAWDPAAGAAWLARVAPIGAQSKGGR
jgi:N-acetylglucosamine kinase-like BadF-type ATPase